MKGSLIMTFDINQMEERMNKSIEQYRKELSGLRTGRAHPSILESLRVDAYGSQMPLSQLASVSVVEARTLSIQVWDADVVPHVEKAILASSLGVSPITEGQVIRINLPEMTEERRREIAKMAGKYAEQCRVAVRQIRRDGMDVLKKNEKDSKISQDEARAVSDDLQKLTDKITNLIDAELDKKKDDLSSI
jgi:ribosome recycling factor